MSSREPTIMLRAKGMLWPETKITRTARQMLLQAIKMRLRASRTTSLETITLLKDINNSWRATTTQLMGNSMISLVART